MAAPYQTITERLETIRRFTAKGGEYWMARELMPILGYDTWRNFVGAIEQAKIAFDAAGESAAHHFADTNKMVMIGSGAERSIDDYYLSRAACYIICMNGDPSKEEPPKPACVEREVVRPDLELRYCRHVLPLTSASVFSPQNGNSAFM